MRSGTGFGTRPGLAAFRGLPEADRVAACLVALAHLPGLGPATLRRCHIEHGAQESWFDIVSGRYERVVPVVEQLERVKDRDGRRLVAAARERDVVADLTSQRRPGWRVHVLGARGYPERLVRDEAAPAILFSCGREDLLHQPTVAIVGTRNATLAGRETAETMAADLVRAGAVVVSGLALGIDGAAHRGALSVRDRRPVDRSAVQRFADETLMGRGRVDLDPDGCDGGPGGGPAPVGSADGGGAADDAIEVSPTVGVVASGLDVIYPRRHADLHLEISRSGLLVTEAPAGFRPEAWRFPARNRIIAGLSDAVVVVESRETGGSMHTVEEALLRDVPVLAVPGHPGSPASAGTNDLLFDGAGMARSATDVIMALGLEAPARSQDGGGGPVDPGGSGPDRSPTEDAVLEALRATPSSLAELVVATGRTVEQVGYALTTLELAGQVGRTGGWYEITQTGRRSS